MVFPAPCSVRLLYWLNKMNKPNLLLLTTGCANSSIVMRQLAALGWNLGTVDKFAEHVPIRRLNHPAERSKRLDEAAAAKVLAALPQPWAIKHPTFSYTLQYWHGVLEPYRPFLLWVTKDLEYVGRSFKRRFNLNPRTAVVRHNLCQGHFDHWPYGKLQLDADQIAAAVRLFDPDRSRLHQES